MSNTVFLFKSLVGSRAYRLDMADSDEDWRGVYTIPTNQYLGLEKPKKTLQGNGQDELFWELDHFMSLVLQNNPNVLEVLWSDTNTFFPNFEHPELKSLIMKMFIHSDKFLSMRVAKTYGGYATSQRAKAMKDYEQDDNKNANKHMMHLCRLLISGRTALDDSYVLVNMESYRDELLAIRRGEWDRQRIDDYVDYWENEFATAKEVSSLPDEPDYEFANDLVTDIRLALLD